MHCRGTPKAERNSKFGSGNANFLLDEVSCDGTESTLEECAHSKRRQKLDFQDQLLLNAD